MEIYGKSIKQHINNISCVFDTYASLLTPQEKESLNAVMHILHILDTLERNNGVIILDKDKADIEENK